MGGEGFNVGRKLSEVSSVYGANKLPAIDRAAAKSGASHSTSCGSSAGGTSSFATQSNGVRVRYSYGEVSHAETASNKLKAEHLRRVRQERAEAAQQQQRERDLRRQRALEARSAVDAYEFDADRAKESKEARELMREISVWTKKLKNCKAELAHRQVEYLHVLAGGDPLEAGATTDFDSDEEKDYSEVRQLLLGTSAADGPLISEHMKEVLRAEGLLGDDGDDDDDAVDGDEGGGKGGHSCLGGGPEGCEEEAGALEDDGVHAVRAPLSDDGFSDESEPPPPPPPPPPTERQDVLRRRRKRKEKPGAASGASPARVPKKDEDLRPPAPVF